MSIQPMTTLMPIQNLQVFPAEAFCVSHGVNRRDPLGIARDLEHEDIYELAENTARRRLAIATHEETGALVIAAGSETGRVGASLFLDSLITFMGPHGSTDEALILVETEAQTGAIAQIYLHPLSLLEAKVGYTLITVDPAGARTKLAESACVSFTRGTHITMADGRQVLIEDLRPGDKVLSRDSGPQELRWIGEQTLRATGPFAPIIIAPGALNNSGELTVSPNHRLFIYQRVDTIGAGQKEVMIKARHLLNGVSVIQAEGGFVDYFQLLFDKHEIIYAEGIASESLFVDTTTSLVVPQEVQKRLAGGARPSTFGRELGANDLAAKDAVDILRRASAL